MLGQCHCLVLEPRFVAETVPLFAVTRAPSCWPATSGDFSSPAKRAPPAQLPQRQPRPRSGLMRSAPTHTCCRNTCCRGMAQGFREGRGRQGSDAGPAGRDHPPVALPPRNTPAGPPTQRTMRLGDVILDALVGPFLIWSTTTAGCAGGGRTSSTQWYGCTCRPADPCDAPCRHVQTRAAPFVFLPTSFLPTRRPSPESSSTSVLSTLQPPRCRARLTLPTMTSSCVYPAAAAASTACDKGQR